MLEDVLPRASRRIAYAVAALLLVACSLILSLAKADVLFYVPDAPVQVFHVVGENSSVASKAVYRTWVESFVKAGAPDGHSEILWKWMEVDSQYFFEELLEREGLPAGSVVVIDNAMLFKSEENAMDTSEIGANPMKRALRPWALMNNSEPLVVILHNDGQCDAPWLRSSHHLLYRDTWCARYHDEWRASQEAEQRYGARAGWLRSIPFGTGFEGGSLEHLAAEQPAVGARSILLHYRGTQAYRKPGRELLYASAQAGLEALFAVAEHAVGAVPPHPSGVGRLVLELDRGPWPRDGPTASESAISHLELLRSSVFTLCPPGDQWEDYRIYEAMEAGSIPVVVRNASYKRCDAPHAHLLATAGATRRDGGFGGEMLPGVLSVASWEELPQVLAAATAEPHELAARQQAMLRWLRQQKQRLFDGIHGAVRRMRSGAWRPKTTCRYTPLHWSHVQQQHQDLAIYWRRAQPRVDHEWNATAFWAYQVGACLTTHEGWCEDVRAGVVHEHPMGLVGNEDLGGIGRCFKGPGCW